MHVSRLVIKNFRNFDQVDLRLSAGPNCIVGENNSGKSNLLDALRLVLDQSLPPFARTLSPDDVHSAIDLSHPTDVTIAVEFSDWQESDKECAFAGEWEIQPDVARLTYRFRPRKAVRDDLDAGERPPGSLAIDDYAWELRGGGGIDPLELTWDQDSGVAPRTGCLQAFQVTFLHPLRDVERDLRAVRTSPLNRVIEAIGIPDDEKATLTEILRDANDKIAASPSITTIGQDIEQAFVATTGPASALALRLGLADPSFSTITRSLRVLLSDSSLSNYEPFRNGLGLNNILYISMLLRYFEARAATEGVAGQLLLIEEPEAHLHPQLQRSLYRVLSEKPFQSIVTTHSTHVTSRAPLQSIVTLTRSEAPAVAAAQPILQAGLEPRQVRDLERYLDATRSTLLYARAVMLVEGPAEAFLLPPLIRKVLDVDLDGEGISVVAIFGTHFESYVRLFGDNAMRKRCAVVGDMDLRPSDSDAPPDPARVAALMALQGDYVRVFLGQTTFERELVLPGMLQPLRAAAEEHGKAELLELLNDADAGIDDAVRNAVLSAARRIGKARFAQTLSKHVELATELPGYVIEAVAFLRGAA